MKKSQAKSLGLLYIIAGALLLILSMRIVFQVLMLVLGLMLINTGLTMRGQRSLWNYVSGYFFGGWHY